MVIIIIMYCIFKSRWEKIFKLLITRKNCNCVEMDDDNQIYWDHFTVCTSIKSLRRTRKTNKTYVNYISKINKSKKPVFQSIQ